MTHRILKSLLPAALVAAISVPAAAQIPIPPLPHMEIHIAHSAPPRPRAEYRAEMPGPGYVWVKGFWNWDGDQWVWIPGRWDRPAGVDVTWVDPHYFREEGGWRYEPGHWSNERVVEGRDYQEWSKHHHRSDRDRDHDRDSDHDHDRR
jgi:hypothetical protein